MALCGFNEKMLKGLEMFAQGLFNQVEKLACKNDLSFHQVLENEMIEIAAFENMLVNRSVDVTALLGATLLVKALYGQSLGATNEEVKNSYEGIVTKELKFFELVDDQYYEKLIPHHDAPEAVAKLGEWIEEYEK